MARTQTQTTISKFMKRYAEPGMVDNSKVSSDATNHENKLMASIFDKKVTLTCN